MKEVYAEVEQYVASITQPMPVSWITHEIVKKHPKIEGDDSDWYTICAFDAVKRVVATVVRRYKGDEKQDFRDAQLVLPGFQRLQARYLVERKGESTIVPIEQCTNDELHARAQEHYAQGRGHILHGDELMRYIANRPDVATS